MSDQTTDEVALPEQPIALNAGRFAEQLWGYAGDVGTYHEMGMRHERACKERAIKALEQIADKFAFAHDARGIARAALAEIKATVKP